jgi:hypothetical protein
MNFLNLLEILIEFSSQNSLYSFRSFSGIRSENILSFGGIVYTFIYMYILVYPVPFFKINIYFMKYFKKFNESSTGMSQ